MSQTAKVVFNELKEHFKHVYYFHKITASPQAAEARVKKAWNIYREALGITENYGKGSLKRLRVLKSEASGLSEETQSDNLTVMKANLIRIVEVHEGYANMQRTILGDTILYNQLLQGFETQLETFKLELKGADSVNKHMVSKGKFLIKLKLIVESIRAGISRVLMSPHLFECNWERISKTSTYCEMLLNKLPKIEVVAGKKKQSKETGKR